jgi:uncharacterized membrane protein (DUF4010 family)
MELTQTFLDLGIALGLGLLVGLQRERVDSQLAGIRTFPVVALLGAVSVILADRFGGVLVAAALVGLAALIVIGNVLKMQAGRLDPGLTTEVALLLVFLVGALVAVGQRAAGIAVGGGLAVLLQLKKPMHRFAGRIPDDDFRAITRFVLIALVILPVLPNRTFGPYQVLNPRQVWWMVVLIVGISLAGYVGYKLLGARAGTLVGGLLGGLVSSTATTVSYARLSHESRRSHEVAAQAVLIASAVVFLRVLVEAAVVSPALLEAAVGPLVLMMVLLAALAVASMLRRREGAVELPPQENPSELRPAVVFALLYALILLAVAWAKDRLGGHGLYVVAAISGLTDMDAITLSTAQLVEG